MGVSSLCEVYVFEEMYYLRNGITQTNITCVTKGRNYLQHRYPSLVLIATLHLSHQLLCLRLTFFIGKKYMKH